LDCRAGIGSEGDGMSPVINVLMRDFDNRPSQMQSAILEILASRGANPPATGFIGNLPRTGDIVDALGRARDKTSYAAVSRSLKRMWVAGKVNAYSPSIATQGMGYRWSLAA
jgi:hypothetical protein